MKKSKGILVFLVVLSMTLVAVQPSLGAAKLTTKENTNFYVIQFSGPIYQEWKEQLRNIGVTFHSYQQLFRYIVEMTPSMKSTVEKIAHIDFVKEYESVNKIHTVIETEEEVTLDIYTFKKTDYIATVLQDIGGTIIESKNNKITVLIDPSAIQTIARISEVESISLGGNTNRLCNEDATWILQTGSYNDRSVTNHGINGDGELLTVMDSELYAGHEMFADPEGDPIGNNHRKIQSLQAYGGGLLTGGNYHGTHVTGTVLGDAPDGTTYATYNKYDGHSIAGRVIFQDIDDANDFWGYVYPPSDLQPPMLDSYNAGSRLQTNSWGGGSGYTDDALEIDMFTWNHKDYNVLFAMGNAGSSANTLSEQPEAKNAISVGGIQNYNSHNSMYSSSSRGYADDGRIKPTILGVAQYVTSADNTGATDYYNMMGTSMATPAIAGQVGQIRQYFSQGWYPSGAEITADGFNPSAALVKAILVNGAEEITGSGAYQNDGRYPNGDQGWGSSTLENSLYFTGDSRILTVYDSWNEGYTLSTGNTFQMNFDISNTAEPVEVTLVWTDYVGPNGANSGNPALVNDLDLEVWAPGGTRYVGNAFTSYNPGYSQPNPTSNYWDGLRTGEFDGLNVVENVLLLPGYNGVVAGTYTVRVTAHNIPEGPQPFALAITGGLGQGNIPPVCTLTANPASGDVPLTVTFSLSASDSDGSIASWELDIDNDGAAEYNGSGDPPATQQHIYSTPGVYTAELTAIDNEGAAGYDTSVITTTEQNQPPNTPTLPDPADSETDIIVNPTLSVLVSDPNSDSMNISFYELGGGLIGTDTNVASGTRASVQWPGRTYNTTYYWYAVANDGEFDSPQSTTWHFTTMAMQPEYFYADQDIPVQNKGISGSYVNTHSSDNIREGIQERESGGKPSNRHSYLEHKWTIPITAGLQSYELYLEAHHSANTESDDFVFAYSTDDNTYIDVITVTKISDDNTYQIYSLPTSLSSPVYIRVKDTDQSRGNRILDTIYIDHMYILGSGTSPPNRSPDKPINPYPADEATNIPLSPTLSVYVNDIDGDNMTVYFYEQGGVPIGTDTLAGSGTASVTWAAANQYLATYYWYAVADDGEYTNDSDTWSFTIKDDTPAGGMYVWDMRWKSAGPNLQSTITVRKDSDNDGIAEETDELVEGAAVYYTLTHQSTGNYNDYIGTTDSSGIVTFQWKKAPSGNYEGLVINIELTGTFYDFSLDVDNPDYHAH